MACFIVPATEAIATTVITKIMENKEKSNTEIQLEQGVSATQLHTEKFSRKLKRLNYLLWGGSGLLAFEHLWHGEIQPFFPFLTAAGNPEDALQMVGEMSTVGVTMAVMVTLVWGVMTFVTSRIEKREAVVATVKVGKDAE